MGTTGSANFFSFGVPSCVNKVEITHATGTRDANTSNSKLVFDCSNANSVTCDYVNEITASDFSTSLSTNHYAHLVNVLGQPYGDDKHEYTITLGEGNQYYVNLDESGETHNLQKVYWCGSVKINNVEHNNVYSFKETNSTTGSVSYAAYEFTEPLTSEEYATAMTEITDVIKNKAIGKSALALDLAIPVKFTFTVVDGNRTDLNCSCDKDGYYSTDGSTKTSKYPGLFTFCDNYALSILKAHYFGVGSDSVTVVVFVKGTSYTLMIPVVSSQAFMYEKYQNFGGMAVPVFKGNYKEVDDDGDTITYDDTLTSKLDFNAVCNAILSTVYTPTTSSEEQQTETGSTSTGNDSSGSSQTGTELAEEEVNTSQSGQTNS